MSTTTGTNKGTRHAEAVVPVNKGKRRAEAVVSVHQKRIRISDTLPFHQKRIRISDTFLFIKEGYIIHEEDLVESVRVLNLEEGKEQEASDDDSNDGLPNEPRWRFWAGVAIAAVATVAVALVRRKR